jgi:hypothetical protein
MSDFAFPNRNFRGRNALTRYDRLLSLYREWNPLVNSLVTNKRRGQDVYKQALKGYALLVKFQTESWKLDIDCRKDPNLSTRDAAKIQKQLRSMSSSLYNRFYRLFGTTVINWNNTSLEKGVISGFICKSIAATKFIGVASVFLLKWNPAAGAVVHTVAALTRHVLKSKHIDLGQLTEIAKVLLCTVDKDQHQRLMLVRNFLIRWTSFSCDPVQNVVCNTATNGPRNQSMRNFLSMFTRGRQTKECCTPPGSQTYSVLQDCCIFSKVEPKISGNPEVQRKINDFWGTIMKGLDKSLQQIYSVHDTLEYQGHVPNTSHYPLLTQNNMKESYERGFRYLQEGAATPVQRYYVVASILFIMLAVGFERQSPRFILNAAVRILTAGVLNNKVVYGLLLIFNALVPQMYVPRCVDPGMLYLLSSMDSYNRIRAFLQWLLYGRLHIAIGKGQKAAQMWTDFTERWVRKAPTACNTTPLWPRNTAR